MLISKTRPSAAASGKACSIWRLTPAVRWSLPASKKANQAAPRQPSMTGRQKTPRAKQASGPPKLVSTPASMPPISSALRTNRPDVVLSPCADQTISRPARNWRIASCTPVVPSIAAPTAANAHATISSESRRPPGRFQVMTACKTSSRPAVHKPVENLHSTVIPSVRPASAASTLARPAFLSSAIDIKSQAHGKTGCAGAEQVVGRGKTHERAVEKRAADRGGNYRRPAQTAVCSGQAEAGCDAQNAPRKQHGRSRRQSQSQRPEREQASAHLPQRAADPVDCGRKQANAIRMQGAEQVGRLVCQFQASIQAIDQPGQCRCCQCDRRPCEKPGDAAGQWQQQAGRWRLKHVSQIPAASSGRT